MANFLPHSLFSPWWSSGSAASSPQNGSSHSSPQNAKASSPQKRLLAPSAASSPHSFLPHNILAPWWSSGSAASSPQHASTSSSPQSSASASSPHKGGASSSLHNDAARRHSDALAHLDVIAHDHDISVIHTCVATAQTLLQDSLTTVHPGNNSRRIHMRGTGNRRSQSPAEMPRKRRGVDPEAATPLLPDGHEASTRCSSLLDEHEASTPLAPRSSSLGRHEEAQRQRPLERSRSIPEEHGFCEEAQQPLPAILRASSSPTAALRPKPELPEDKLMLPSRVARTQMSYAALNLLPEIQRNPPSRHPRPSALDAPSSEVKRRISVPAFRVIAPPRPPRSLAPVPQGLLTELELQLPGVHLI